MKFTLEIERSEETQSIPGLGDDLRAYRLTIDGHEVAMVLGSDRDPGRSYHELRGAFVSASRLIRNVIVGGTAEAE